MIWNTIAHPRMMDDTSGTGNTPESEENKTLIFSEEALAPPFKHMNRGLLSTFDVIVLEAQYFTDSGFISKQIPLLGDFDTVYHAAKSGAVLYAMLIIRSLTLDQDSILQPADAALRFYQKLSIPIVLEGKYENGLRLDGGFDDIDAPIDFKDDRFVFVMADSFGLVFLSTGEIYDASIWYNDILPKYIITGTDSESENSN